MCDNWPKSICHYMISHLGVLLLFCFNLTLKVVKLYIDFSFVHILLVNHLLMVHTR